VIFGFILHQQEIERIRHSELERANTALRESEALLERRVEERTHALELAKEEAEAARERAEQADRVKSQFLASMSHELRTPMNAILNFTEMTAMGMLGPVNEQQEDALRKSLDSGKHLLALINDVLDITKMHSGTMKLFLEDNINLKPEIDAVIETAGSLLKNSPVALVTEIDAICPACASISGASVRCCSTLYPMP
jgi:signal transduction histidine kinase